MSSRAVFFLVGTLATLIAPSAFAESRTPLRCPMARPAEELPENRSVQVIERGKTFHRAGCTFIHQKTDQELEQVPATKAVDEGYVPCIRCEPTK